ncbi:hypothetical protein V5F55_12900 [Xanthobacter sp. V3C-4]
MQLALTHRKLMDVARELYKEYGWQMPRGLARSKASDPANFTLAEWQQAKRRQKDPRTIKTASRMHGPSPTARAPWSWP